jgi:hypothetical protein
MALKVEGGGAKEFSFMILLRKSQWIDRPSPHSITKDKRSNQDESRDRVAARIVDSQHT